MGNMKIDILWGIDHIVSILFLGLSVGGGVKLPKVPIFTVPYI